MRRLTTRSGLRQSDLPVDAAPAQLRVARRCRSLAHRAQLSTTFENEAIAAVENEAIQTDWMGDLSGGLGSYPAAGCGRCSAAPGRTGPRHWPVDPLHAVRPSPQRLSRLVGTQDQEMSLGRQDRPSRSHGRLAAPIVGARWLRVCFGRAAKAILVNSQSRSPLGPPAARPELAIRAVVSGALTCGNARVKCGRSCWLRRPRWL